MSFLRRLRTIIPSFGTPQSNDTTMLFQNIVVASGTAITIPVQPTPAPATPLIFSPTVSSGWIRVKVFDNTTPPPATPVVITTTAIKVIGNDAGTVPGVTTTVSLGGYNPATPTATNQTDIVFPFLTDLNLTSLSITVTATGATTLAADIEIGGVSGDF
jgi:hypothetical protein